MPFSFLVPLVDINNTLHFHSKSTCEILRRYYCSVYFNLDAVGLPCISDVIIEITISDITFHAPDILRDIDKFKYNSAVGPEIF